MANCTFCDRTFPHYHSEVRAPNGDLVEAIVAIDQDHPRAEVRDRESGEVIFPAIKGPLALVEPEEPLTHPL